MDKKIYQGRILHIKPALKKPPKVNVEENEDSYKKDFRFGSSSYKDQARNDKVNFDSEANWNYLFLNSNAVANQFANRASIKKGDILNKDDDNLAVRMLNIETQAIKETKEWMIEQGLNIEVFENQTTR